MSISNHPLVSIITPAFNASGFIEETINSVINQSYNNWEMIIVDDFSSDDTYEIANHYAKKDSRINVYRNEKNMGVAATRNKGLRIARGEFIAFLDSDDIWKKEKLESQLAFMFDNGVAISYSYYCCFVDDISHPIKLIKCPLKATQYSVVKSNYMGCLTVMVNKNKVGDFYMPNLNHGEDMLTWYGIMSKGFTARCVPEVLAYYRLSKKSLSSNKHKTAKKQWTIYREYLHFPFLKCVYYFTIYSILGLLKHLYA